MEKSCSYHYEPIYLFVLPFIRNNRAKEVNQECTTFPFQREKKLKVRNREMNERN